MLRRLAVNTFITGTAFLVTGLIPLLLVPLFVSQYGVSEYGLLVLVRLLLPTGALAFLDFGKSEVASFAVAKARHGGDWGRCGRYLAALLLIALVLGIPAAAALAVSVDFLGGLFHVPQPAQQGFRDIVFATACAFPLLLASLVAEGVLKGFEDFKRLRLVEVAAILGYAAVALAVVAAGLPYQWAALAYLAYAVCRAIAVGGHATLLLMRRGVRLRLPDSGEWADLKTRCWPLGINRAIGVAQGYAAPLLIGVILGTAAVGLYDLVTRIPRFFKVATGFLNAAVLPTVMTLDAAGDREGVRRLFDLGLLGVICIVAALVAWGMSFSEAILRLWVSDKYATLWAWQALMFAWPLANAITSFTCGALLGRPHFVKLLNFIVFGQIIFQIVISFILLPLFGEQAFVAGQIAVVCASLPLQLRLVARECGLHVRDFARHFAAVAVFAVAVAASLFMGASSVIRNPLGLGISLAAWLGLSGLFIGGVILTRTERMKLLSIIGFRAP